MVVQVRFCLMDAGSRLCVGIKVGRWRMAYRLMRNPFFMELTRIYALDMR